MCKRDREADQDTSGEVDGGEEKDRLQSREGVHLPPLLLHLHHPPYHHITNLTHIPVHNKTQFSKKKAEMVKLTLIGGVGLK